MTVPVNKNVYAPRQRYSTPEHALRANEKEDVVLDALANDLAFVLKSGKKEAVLKERDVFAVLSKAFGKKPYFPTVCLGKKFKLAECSFIAGLNLMAHQ